MNIHSYDFKAFYGEILSERSNCANVKYYKYIIAIDNLDAKIITNYCRALWVYSNTQYKCIIHSYKQYTCICIVHNNNNNYIYCI